MRLGGVAAARRLLLERCEMRRDNDGQFRSIREALPGGALKAAKARRNGIARPYVRRPSGVSGNKPIGGLTPLCR
jgi:hypothetical protein